MDLNEVVCALGLEDYREVFAGGWEEAEAGRPERLFFLEAQFLREMVDWCSLPDEAGETAIAAAGRIVASPELTALVWYLHHCLYREPGYDRGKVYGWPPVAALEPTLGEEAGMLYLLGLVSGLPRVLEYHRAHEVPEEVTRAVLADVRRFSEPGEERKAWGLWGPDRAGWLVRHFQGDFYRLGRLQFEFGGFGGGIVMFRNMGTGKVLALAEEGVRFLPDGRLWTEARERKGEESWTASLGIGEREISGHVVTVRGHAKPGKVTLPAGEWRQALAKGDPVLHLHIAPGGPMDHAACGESFAWAERFFPEHFPERPFLAYCCNSWLLDTQLAEFLSPEANMARFQREMYLFQTITSDENLLRPIYGQIPQFQPSPRNTSLQRALSDFLEAGGVLRGDGGGSVILREDLDWGGEVYRRGRADDRAWEGD